MHARIKAWSKTQADIDGYNRHSSYKPKYCDIFVDLRDDYIKDFEEFLYFRV